MDRVVLGKKLRADEYYSAVCIQYIPSLELLTINDAAFANYQLDDILEMSGFSDGSVQRIVVTVASISPSQVYCSQINLNGSPMTFAEASLEFTNNVITAKNLTHTERLSVVEYGLFVSKSGFDVLEAVDPNLSFDSSDPGLATLRVIQTGTFQIQCKKTYMGKKGNLEVASDEQMRANAEYTRLYPFELDTQSDADFYTSSPENTDIAALGFREGQTEFTGNGYAHQNIQNVYCDYGSTTVEFNPPLPDNIKTPFVSVSFAVANNSGHFHPWYANVTCTPGQEDYQWQYANSQHCVHMDSAWFRGKWTFRERNFSPFGTNLNNDYGTDQSVLYDTIGAELSGDNQFGLNVPRYANPTATLPNAETVDPFSFNQGGTSRPDSVGGVTGTPHGLDLNSPSSVWGGAFKSFAGMQGISYFANNTHLKIDAFMTPTHTPTPFETEIVKTRVANPDADADASQYDEYGNIKTNVGRDTVTTIGGSGTTSVHNDRAWSQDVGVAWDSRYGETYKEKLPRMFRTKYWDGAQTEFEWWPLGHANGDFNIGYALYDSPTLFSGFANTILPALASSASMDNESVSMGFDSSDNKLMQDHAMYSAATYGDYNPIAYMGLDTQTATAVTPVIGNQHSPFWAIINKGTRFPNQLPSTEGKGYPSNSQYEPGDAFLKTRTFQGQPTSLDSFWNSFSNNTSQWVSSNTPYGEFYYADGGYAMDISPYHNYAGDGIYAAEKTEEERPLGFDVKLKLVKVVPSDDNVQSQSLAKHNWNGGNPKAGVGTEGRRFGFGGAGSAEALGGEGEGVFDTYIGKYIIYDIEGSDTNV